MNQPFSRRNFLKLSGLAAAGAALAACKPGLMASPTASPGTRTATPAVISPTPNAPNPVTPLPTLIGTDLLTHALRRLTFGATPELVAHAHALGLDAWLDEQLHPETIEDSQTELLLGHLSTLAMTPEARSQLDKRGLPAQEIVLATLIRQRYSSRQVYELAVDFWSNHFNIYLGKNQCRFLKTDDDLQTIRPNALGKFADLLSASAHSPAMLVYLDNAESTKDIPNENYARELMELHTLSVNGGYSQFDVTALAQALTGWGVAGERDQRRFGTPLGTYLFRSAVHDETEKRILDLVLPPGGGEQEGLQALNYLAQHSHTAHFISTKLVRRFVADDPPAPLVDSLSAVFTTTGGDMRELLKALVRSPEFAASAGQKVKRPLEFFISALRLTNAQVTTAQRGLAQRLKMLGQIPFSWEQPDGYPDYAAWWTTTSGLLNRWNFGLQLSANQIPGLEVDLAALTRDATSPADVVDVLSQRFLGATLPEDARAILLDFASAGDLGQNLASIAGLILGSPHFQVR